MNAITLEICIDSIASALAAQEGGAHRIELCANLIEGGTTPSAATIEIVRKHLTIDVNVIIRPRGGDFLYSELEFAIMRRDIEIAKELGANGVVTGLLSAYGHVDVERTEELITLARPLSVTFHRAFDMVADPVAALDALIGLGVDRVLTSGLEPSALEGAETIADLVQRAAGRIIVMPGGGINERNIAKIVQQTGAHEVHMSGRSSVESQMRYRNHRVVMGGSLHPPEFSQLIASADRIGASLAAVQKASQPS